MASGVLSALPEGQRKKEPEPGHALYDGSETVSQTLLPANADRRLDSANTRPGFGSVKV
jgi:hypothetical protein